MNKTKPEAKGVDATLDELVGSDDEDDLFADDPMAFIER